MRRLRKAAGANASAAFLCMAGGSWLFTRRHMRDLG